MTSTLFENYGTTLYKYFRLPANGLRTPLGLANGGEPIKVVALWTWPSETVLVIAFDLNGFLLEWRHDGKMVRKKTDKTIN
jgi:hypothetical protein